MKEKELFDLMMKQSEARVKKFSREVKQCHIKANKAIKILNRLL